MAKTNADYQREHRERRADRLAELETALADRDADLAAARARIARLERELDGVYAMLEAVPAEPEASRPHTPECPHPSEAVDGGRCHACGSEVW
jgi:hypothetical protein